MNYAILTKDHQLKEVTLMEWASMFENTKDRIVAKDNVGDVLISTVFLGMDHGFGGKPLWFETMIFGGEHNEYQERYETWDEAVKGHEVALQLVKK